MSTRSEVAGVDAYRRGKATGWVAVRLRDGTFVDAIERRELSALVDKLQGCSVIAIDMPIGLPSDGSRPCDEQAREFIGVRRSSVFLAPPRPALEQNSHTKASSRAKELTGSGVSQQAYGLRKKLFEVEAVAAGDSRIVEVHPEVSFRELAGAEVEYPKKSWNGQAMRRRWLSQAGLDLPEDIGDAGAIPPDDVLDAAVAAWTAARIARGDAIPMPTGSERGDAMVIWR